MVLAQNAGAVTAQSFHNFVLEVWVGTGVVGLLAMAVLLGTTIWRSGRLFLLTRSPTAAYALTATGLAIPLSLVGTSLFRQHEFTIMMVVMLGVAAGRELEAVARAARAAQAPGDGPVSAASGAPDP